jgi:hypothetical protein
LKELKDAVSTNLVKFHVRWQDELYLSTDASAQDYGSVLYQVRTFAKADLPALRAQLASEGDPDAEQVQLVLKAKALPNGRTVLPPSGKRVPPIFDLHPGEELLEPIISRDVALILPPIKGPRKGPQRPECDQDLEPILEQGTNTGKVKIDSHPTQSRQGDLKPTSTANVVAGKMDHKEEPTSAFIAAMSATQQSAADYPPASDSSHPQTDEDIKDTGNPGDKPLDEEHMIHQIVPVGFHSGIFRIAQTQYSILEKETVSTLEACSAFRDMLAPAKAIFLLTDSATFLWVLRFKSLGCARLERFAARLLSLPFRLIITHSKGIYTASDVLTRQTYKVQGPNVSDAK